MSFSPRSGETPYLLYGAGAASGRCDQVALKCPDRRIPEDFSRLAEILGRPFAEPKVLSEVEGLRVT